MRVHSVGPGVIGVIMDAAGAFVAVVGAVVVAVVSGNANPPRLCASERVDAEIDRRCLRSPSSTPYGGVGSFS